MFFFFSTVFRNILTVQLLIRNNKTILAITIPTVVPIILVNERRKKHHCSHLKKHGKSCLNSWVLWHTYLASCSSYLCYWFLQYKSLLSLWFYWAWFIEGSVIEKSWSTHGYIHFQKLRISLSFFFFLNWVVRIDS